MRELYRTLKRRGVQPWLDAEDLIPGQNWEMEIPKALLSSDAIIICLTPNSVDKEGYVQKEIKFALDKAMEMPEGRIFIIPARLEDCELPFSLRQYQAVNLYEKAGYTKLMQALKLRASQLERATVELPKKGETTAEIKKVVEEKKHPEPKEEKTEIKTPKPSQDKVGVGGDVKDSVIVSGSGNVINIGEQKKPEPEKPQPKKTKPSSKPNTAVIVAIIGLVGTVCAALISSPLLADMFSRTPEPTQIISTETEPTKIVPTFTKTKTPLPIDFSRTPTRTPTLSITPTPLITKSLNINQESYLGPKKLYFVSKEKSLNILDIFSGQFQQIAELEKFDKDSTLFWIDDSSLAIWTSDQLHSLNLDTNSVQNITSSEYKYRLSLLSSDLSSERKFLVSYGVQRNDPRTIYGHDSFLLFLVSLDDKGVLSSPINIGLDLSGVYEASCIRWRPNSSIPTVSLRVAELEGLVVGTPSLAVLRIGPEESPIILKENIIDCPSWSPDGEKIVYGKSGESSQGIYYIEVVLNAVTKITDTDGYYPVWSPDGSTIAFITENGISLIDVNTKEEKQIYSGKVLALLWGK